MLKLLTAAVAALFVASSAFAAGTVPGFSLAQQQDSNGTPLVGCKLYTIQAGTTSTPQNGYQDAALTIPLPNPIICDAYGRLPQIFLADGSIKLRLTKSNGVQVFAADGILVVGTSSGGGGGSPVDATTILATGDLKARYGTGVISGFVRANGRTIGSVTSGATERANADCQVLFQYLWDTDANLAVSSGRGASSAADWAANKTIATPDWRGRAMAFMDDMGNSAAGLLTTANSGVNGIVLGASGGFPTLTLTTANLPPYTPSGSVSVTSTVSDIMRSPTGATDNYTSIGGICCFINQVRSGITSTGTLTGTAQGGTSTAFTLVQPTMVATLYIKL